eukprot:14023_1
MSLKITVYDKFLVAGFVASNRIIIQNIPEDVVQVILEYFSNNDALDLDAYTQAGMFPKPEYWYNEETVPMSTRHQTYVYNPEERSIVMNTNKHVQSFYFSQIIAEERIYRWTFEVLMPKFHKFNLVAIGVIADHAPKCAWSTDQSYFNIDEDQLCEIYAVRIPLAWSYDVHQLCEVKNCDYVQITAKDHAIVQMTLNLETKTLSYTIDGKPFREDGFHCGGFTIHPSAYVAFVTLTNFNVGIKLLKSTYMKNNVPKPLQQPPLKKRKI